MEPQESDRPAWLTYPGAVTPASARWGPEGRSAPLVQDPWGVPPAEAPDCILPWSLSALNRVSRYPLGCKPQAMP